MLTDFYHTMLC